MLSEQATAALKSALVSRGANKGTFLKSAPRSNTLEYAAWQGAMLSINPYKASIAALMFMTPEQRAIGEEITKYFDAMPRSQRIVWDRDRHALETLGVW